MNRHLTQFLFVFIALSLAQLPAADAKKSANQPTTQPAKTGHVHHHGHKHHHRHGPPRDIKKYIKLLERPDRKAWQKPDLLISALKLKPTDHIADIGAGGGYFTFRFAKAVPKGRVYAVEIESVMLQHIRRRASAEGITNISAIMGSANDPKVPKPVDVMFICNVLHHIAKPIPYLKKMAATLKKGGRLVLVEFKMGKLPFGPPETMKIPKRRVLKMLAAAGFKLSKEIKSLLPHQYLLVFKK